MTIRISPTLQRQQGADGGAICCSGCGHVVAPAGSDKHWKELAVLKVGRVGDIAGWPASVHQKLVHREFTCAGCGALLDSEMALDDDPFLFDVVEG